MSRLWLAIAFGFLIGHTACDSASSPPPSPAPVSKAAPKTPDPDPPTPQDHSEPPPAPVSDPPPPLLKALPAVQEPAAAGFILERTVKLKVSDLTGRESEVHRRERVTIKGTRVSIDDETFGRRLVIRPDLGLAWVIDRVDGTYSEVTFEAVAKRRAEILKDLQAAIQRVAGSSDEKLISDVLLRLGELPAGMQVAVRPTDRTEKVGGRDVVGREIRLGGDRPGVGISYINVMVDPTLQDALGYFEALAKLGAFNPEVAERLKQLGGFPVRGDVRYTLFFDLVKSSEEVTSAGRADVADAAFEKPEGLSKVPLRSVEQAAWIPPAKPKDFQRSFREDEIDRERNPFRQDDKK